MKKILFLIIILSTLKANSQSLPVGFPVLEEGIRRAQLLGNLDSTVSFTVRPVYPTKLSETFNPYTIQIMGGDSLSGKDMLVRFWKGHGKIQLLPVQLHTEFNTHHPYPQVNGPMVQNRGFQTFASIGAYAELGPLTIQFQPEHIWAQNKDYAYGNSKSIYTEYLERYGHAGYNTLLMGQSSIRLNLGAFSAGVSNENIWWGPGQYNSLLFSNNAFGFQHLTLNTRKPAKTFLGSFEGQFIMGRLEGSEFPELTQHNLTDDWRYINGINISYQPKWIPGLFVGLNRVFQQYDRDRTNSLGDWFPIFEVFTKESLFEDGNTVEYDERAQDQQVTIFGRYVIPKAKAELYFEYGKRDHSVNWREFFINPDHARAFLMGFSKLFSIENNAFIQVRGEMLQQQESINMLIRYPGTGGDSNWGGHYQVRHGFTHRGQMLGPGVGPSSNVQTIETAWVKGTKKLGIRLDRLNRHQDIYVKQFNDTTSQGRWVDLNLGLLADWQFDRLLLSSQLYFINSLNYQWQLHPNSTPDFPKGHDVFNVQGQIRAAYLF
ncbi:capsule assembly Wzi family protein [Anditalea andensis]|uniref:Capsule assembly protein Wzi n=1 Tax=Anditalea andensis TaxID=1048983 RepID=A0A074KWY5_9BACT|nr:capsule assembly Wzi family protein [Anditalea andensis]KEO73474.1 hypothetical protein EL17_11245 [Anditalea andensis]